MNIPFCMFREINFDKFDEYVEYLRNHHFQYAFGKYHPLFRGALNMVTTNFTYTSIQRKTLSNQSIIIN